jgi:formyltetrahydrofolate deformylase
MPLLPELNAAFEREVAGRFAMKWQFHEAARHCRVMLAVSQLGHCLNSILHRASMGSLPVEIMGVVSNHEGMRGLVEWHGLPFHYLPIGSVGKAAQEQLLIQRFEAADAELLVLARYMQILSDDACRYFAGRAINIHHSFLPGFKGARAYHQAHERGVKLIGATAHYATTDLDEGPIIEQEIERVGHALTPEEFVDIGRDLESVVLTRAVRWHAERRVFLNGAKTVVLR